MAHPVILEVSLPRNEREAGADVSSLTADLGLLMKGETADIVIKFEGGPAHATIDSDRISVSPGELSSERGEFHIQVLAGVPGELLWDSVELRNEVGEAQVTVVAQWAYHEDLSAVLTSEQPRERQSSEQNTGYSVDTERSYRGRRCWLCGRNFAYDVDRHGWEMCTCSGGEKVKRLVLRLARGLVECVSETLLGILEILEVLSGRDGVNSRSK